MPIDPKKLNGHNKFSQEFLKIIDEYGWFVMSVVPGEDDGGDAWTFSTGLFYRYRHPEVIIFNGPAGIGHSMINALGDRVKAGEKFQPGKSYAHIIGDFDVQFRPMHPSHYLDWVYSACWFYDNDPNSFPMLQCFWPDMNGKFPWEPECADWAIEQQPLHDKPKEADKKS